MTPWSLHLDGASLHIAWNDGTEPCTLSAIALRLACRCAACQRDHDLGRPSPPASDLALLDASPIGRYGIQLHFSDGHDRGIYPWAYLAELAAGTAWELATARAAGAA